MPDRGKRDGVGFDSVRSLGELAVVEKRGAYPRAEVDDGGISRRDVLVEYAERSTFPGGVFDLIPPAIAAYEDGFDVDAVGVGVIEGYVLDWGCGGVGEEVGSCSV